jgi:hypothetical protein
MEHFGVQVYYCMTEGCQRYGLLSVTSEEKVIEEEGDATPPRLASPIEDAEMA